MKFTFTNKEEYLAYRSAWKTEYKELSRTIKERKWLHSKFASMANKANLEVGMDNPNIIKYFNYIQMLEKENVKYSEIRAKQNWKISKEKLSVAATKMLEELKLSQIEANRQYLTSKQQLVNS